MSERRARSKGIVHLRKRKLLDGSTSLYLDIYSLNRRYTKTLNLKLVPGKSPIDRKSNAKTLQLAETIRAEMQLDLQHAQHGVQNDDNLDKSFLNYFLELTEKRKASKGNYGNWDSAYKHLQKFAKGDVLFRDLDRTFVRDFKEYLTDDAKTKSNVNLSANSQTSYFNKFRAAVNQAVNDGILQVNPNKGIKGIKGETPERSYLTLEELKKMAKTECKYQILKDAFLFSCMTGLRWSDIQKMTWAEVRDEEKNTKVVFRQKKTKGQEYLPISKQARELLGDRGDQDERVFSGLKYSAHNNHELERWAMRAGISKHITFHSGRHTFATIQLTLGTGIYTLSKLLGHSELRTTQIYGDIIDSEKEEAMDRIPDIGIG
jgi:integrase